MDAGAEAGRDDRGIDVAAMCAAAIDRSPLPTAIVEGEEHVLLYANAPFLDLVDGAGDSALGRPFGESFPELSAAGTLALLDRARAAGAAAIASEGSMHPPRGGRHGMWAVWPVDAADTPEGRLFLQRMETSAQVVESRRLEALRREARELNERLIVTGVREQEMSEERARLLEKAQEANRAKASFLATVSHELRTPLNAIVGYSELLGAGIVGELNAKQKAHLGRIQAGTRHLIDLIEEILSFARIEAGREEVHRHRVDVCELAEEAAALIEPLSQERGLVIQVRTPERAVAMETDSGKVRQILINLLGNAVKFTNAGEIGLDVREEGTDVLLVVSDSGIGIEPEMQERIFEPFHQAKQLDARSSGGTGLGLAVSRQLARLLGGELTLESTPGEGSTFTARLPRGAGAPAGPDMKAGKVRRGSHA